MILITTILEHVRKRKKYSKRSLADHLALTMPELGRILAKGYIEKLSLLSKWCDFLELPEDTEPVFQLNTLSQEYQRLAGIGIEPVLAETLAQVICFRNQLDLNKLRAQILEQTIHCLLRQPFDVSNAIMDLRVNARD